jgi:hypothetical protein
MVVWVNIGWAVLNLLPILPLDGGHVASNLFSIVTGRSGERFARILSVVACVVLGVVAVSLGYTFGILYVVVLAAMNISALKRATPGFVRVQQPPSRRAQRAREQERGDAPGGGPERPSAQQLLASGFTALERQDVDGAAAAADQVLALEPYPDVARAAGELRAWAALRRRDLPAARAALAALPAGRKADRFLRAIVEAVGGGDTGPVVEAFLFGGEGVERSQAALVVADAGMLDPVVCGLVGEGTEGRRRAGQVAAVLERSGRAADAIRVQALLGEPAP